MSIVTARGGIPIPFRGEALGLTPVQIVFGKHMHLISEFEERTNLGVCKYLVVQNHDTSDDLRIYFHEGDIAKDNFVLVHADGAATAYGVWRGPVEARSVWVRAHTNEVAAFDIVAFMRRN